MTHCELRSKILTVRQNHYRKREGQSRMLGFYLMRLYRTFHVLVIVYVTIPILFFNHFLNSLFERFREIGSPSLPKMKRFFQAAERTYASGREPVPILSLAQLSFKKLRIEVAGQAGYIDKRFLLATSNICETLFSKAGFALGERQKIIDPSKLKEQLLSQTNLRIGT